MPSMSKRFDSPVKDGKASVDSNLRSGDFEWLVESLKADEELWAFIEHKVRYVISGDHFTAKASYGRL